MVMYDPDYITSSIKWQIWLSLPIVGPPLSTPPLYNTEYMPMFFNQTLHHTHLHWVLIFFFQIFYCFVSLLKTPLTLSQSILPPCYTPCNTAPELWSPLPPDPSSFQDPYCVSLLSSNLNSIFGTPCAQPSPTLPVLCPFLTTLTEALVIPSWTYSSPCWAHDPA